MWVFRRTCYHLATPAIAALARSESIYKSEKFSDHAPSTVEYELTLWRGKQLIASRRGRDPSCRTA